jgi:Restriction endonuclease
MNSSAQRGNAFRALVASLLEAAGFIAESEIRVNHNKVDVRWRREDIGGPVRYLVEAKDCEATVSMPACREFVADYGTLIEARQADRAWLVCKGPISQDGRALVDSKRDLNCLTFSEFNRKLMGIDSYLHDIVAGFDAEGTANWYIRPYTTENEDIENKIRHWMDEHNAPQIAVVSGYGKGKSTFARHLAASLAREALTDPTCRAPVLVPLGDIADEQSLEGLLGKVFTSRPGVRGYNFGLFEKLNQSGRFIIIFDGFNEMKHGMTISQLEANFVELMRLDKGAAKIVFLGRDTIFHEDFEFRSIILARQTTAGGQEVRGRGRRSLKEMGIRDFSVNESHFFVRKFFTAISQEPGDDALWISRRIEEMLDGSFDSLISRPVHAQMLCHIATDKQFRLRDLSKRRLFDRFVHFLLDREATKRGRDPRISLHIRRRFNMALAWWLWRQGAPSAVSLGSMPIELCRLAMDGIDHDYDDASLRRELIAGCLIQKSNEMVHFCHRSLQEFLVAESFFSREIVDNSYHFMIASRMLNTEIVSFVLDAVKSSPERRDIAKDWFTEIKELERPISVVGMHLFIELAKSLKLPDTWDSIWFVWISYFIVNGSVDCIPRSKEAAEYLILLTEKGVRMAPAYQSGTLLLALHAVARTPDAQASILPRLIAAWVDHRSFAKAIASVKLLTLSQHDDVVTEEISLPLYTFLHATNIEVSAEGISIALDVNSAIMHLQRLAKIGIEEWAAEQVACVLKLPVSELYRAWRISDEPLNNIRVFFENQDARGRIVRALKIKRKLDPWQVPSHRDSYTWEKNE